MDNRLLVQSSRGPGDTSSVVAVGCGKESRGTECFLQFRACKIVISDIADMFTQFMSDVASHRK